MLACMDKNMDDPARIGLAIMPLDGSANHGRLDELGASSNYGNHFYALGGLSPCFYFAQESLASSIFWPYFSIKLFLEKTTPGRGE